MGKSECSNHTVGKQYAAALENSLAFPETNLELTLDIEMPLLGTCPGEISIPICQNSFNPLSYHHLKKNLSPSDTDKYFFILNMSQYTENLALGMWKYLFGFPNIFQCIEECLALRRFSVNIYSTNEDVIFCNP